MDEVSFRKAGGEDIDDLIEFRMRFLEEYKGHPRDSETDELMYVTREYLERSIPENGFVAYLAEKDGRTVASGGMEVREVTPRYGPLRNGRMGYVMNMYTLPGHRGKGIGTRILELLVDEAKKLDLGQLHLHASDDGAGIYRELGFRDADLPEKILPLD